MRDHDLHGRFDQWFAKSATERKNHTEVLQGQYARVRLRYIDGWVHIANIAVRLKHRRQGVFTSFLEHCEETGSSIVVEFVENEHLQQFMERRQGYAREDRTAGYAPSWRREAR